MGFYGNITNTSKTQFQFDRIYPNRAKMDENKMYDGIYMGRYVLVDYDQSKRESYRTFYLKDGKFYELSGQESAKIEVNKSHVKEGEHIRAIETWVTDESKKYNEPYFIYKCTGFTGSTNIAQFIKVSGADSVYTTNYEIDTREYGSGRGFDSTVWQKVYVENQIKYVMIAELNSVVPSFEVVEDAPTMTPLPPHFDQASNNVHYKMHYQPQWGLRVREANGKDSTNTEKVDSDEKVIWKKYSYDVKTDTETVKESEEEGAIFYNKAGFDPKVISYIDPAELENKITVEPTGYSGHLYNVHNAANPAEKARANDIQEISILLPAIGNSISQMWDVVYGGKDISDAEGKRNMDIAWDSYEGHRLVEKEPLGNGFTYSPEKVETLAGAINSVHDLMGMIVVDVDNEQQILDGDLNKIYFWNGKYYRKKQGINFTDIEITDSNYFQIIGQTEEDKLDITDVNYKQNHYYQVKDNELIADFNKQYDSEKIYAETRLVGVGIPNTPVEGLVEYKPNTYFYKENYGKTYVKDDSEKYNKNKIYYEVDFKQQTLDASYVPNTYYTTEEIKLDGKTKLNYLLATSERPITGKTYYTVTFDLISGEKPYQRNTYFYIQDNKYYIKDKGEKLTSGRTYFSATETSSGQVIIKNEEGQYEIVTAYTLENIEEVKLFDITDLSDKAPAYFYKNNNNYYRTNAVVSGVTEYYTLDSKNKKKIDNFYVSNTYYILQDDGKTYVLDEGVELIEEKKDKYYKKAEETQIKTFYESGKFVDENGNFINDDTMPSDKTLYYKEEFYISPNSLDPENAYALWNNNVTIVPCSITLAIKDTDSVYIVEELSGFARELNTIHGLILQINKLLEADDKQTRDLSTIQGVVNKLNDIIYKIDELKAEQFLIVDHYGRIHGADFGTLQDDSYNKNKTNDIEKDIVGDKFKTASSVNDMRKQWITVNVNGDTENPSVTVHHNYQPVTSTKSEYDKNTKTGSGTHQQVNKDKIQLYTPIVDAMGHVVGQHDETVVLPYSYKTLITNGINNNIKDDLFTHISEGKNGQPDTSSLVTDTKTSIEANETQDTIAVDPVNKWIQIKLESDTLKIAHEIHAIDTVAQASNLNIDNVESNSDNDKITFHDLEFDKAGHVIKNQKHTYTLPYGFKTIKTNGRSDKEDENASGTPDVFNVVAENTQDELTINSGNKWIRIDTDNNADSITISHDIHNTSSTTSQKTLSNENSEDVTFEIPTYSFDKAGHYISHDAKTLTMPFGYGKIVGDNGDTAASATFDTLTFGSDEWLTATVEKDKIVYSHDYPREAADTTSTSNVNGNGDTIVLETLVHDEKGHIVNVNQNTVTLPYGYKTFTGDSGSTSADNTQDTMSIAGDNWIGTTVANDSIALNHKAPVIGEIINKNNDEPKFGETFVIDDHYFDTNGHKFNSQSHTVKIPALSLTPGAGNVVVGISLTPEDGAFVETKADIGTLALIGYEKPTSVSNENILATESLNIGLGKLEYRLENEANRAIEAEKKNEETINAEIERAKNREDEINKNLGTEIKNTVTNAIEREVAERQDAINALSENIYKYIEELMAARLEVEKNLMDEINALKQKIDELHPVVEEEEEELPEVQEPGIEE